MLASTLCVCVWLIDLDQVFLWMLRCACSAQVGCRPVFPDRADVRLLCLCCGAYTARNRF